MLVIQLFLQSLTRIAGSLLFLEDFSGHSDGSYRVRPARVKRQMSDGFDQLVLRHTVFARLDEMRVELMTTTFRSMLLLMISTLVNESRLSDRLIAADFPDSALPAQ